MGRGRRILICRTDEARLQDTHPPKTKTKKRKKPKIKKHRPRDQQQQKVKVASLRKQVKPNNNSSKQGKAKATQKKLVLETAKSLVGSEKSVGGPVVHPHHWFSHEPH